MRRNWKYNILKERVNMDRKPKPDTYVAPMPQKLFHAAQFRDGRNDGSIRSVYKNEIEAKRQLLARAKEFQLTEPEIRHTRISLELYERELRKLEKGDTGNDSI